jgi:hypothetical protein
LLDISRNGDWLDVFELLKASPVAPGQKLIDGPVVSFAGIGVANRHREELGKPLNGRWVGVGQDRGYGDGAGGPDIKGVMSDNN